MTNKQISEVESIMENLLYIEDDGKTYNVFIESADLFSTDPEVIKGVGLVLEALNSGKQDLLEMETSEFLNSLN